jgi:hypothetical protein
MISSPGARSPSEEASAAGAARVAALPALVAFLDSA